MKKESFSYDDYSDNLIVSNREENQKVKENFEVGDIVFSLTGKGKIVAIEIREASSFLESCGIDPEILRHAKNFSLKIMPKKDTIFLVLKIEFVKNEQSLEQDIPLVVPLANQ